MAAGNSNRTLFLFQYSSSLLTQASGSSNAQQHTIHTIHRVRAFSTLIYGAVRTTFDAVVSCGVQKIRLPTHQVSQPIDGVQKAGNTRYSQPVTHASTNRAQRCLTSVIGREPVFPTWYGRRQTQPMLHHWSISSQAGQTSQPDLTLSKIMNAQPALARNFNSRHTHQVEEEIVCWLDVID